MNKEKKKKKKRKKKRKKFWKMISRRNKQKTKETADFGKNLYRFEATRWIGGAINLSVNSVRGALVLELKAREKAREGVVDPRKVGDQGTRERSGQGSATVQKKGTQHSKARGCEKERVGGRKVARQK